MEHEVQCWGADPYPGATVRRPELPAIQVSVNGVGCLLTEDQHVTCWGNDETGALNTPLDAFASVASGQRHACVLDAEGKASCWGENGLYTIVPPADISFTRLVAGDEATCGLMIDAGLRCWGATRDWDWYLYIAGFEPEGIYTDVALGRDLACAVRDDGGVLCGPFGISSDYPPVDDPLFADE
jgi:hypothetical protein